MYSLPSKSTKERDIISAVFAAVNALLMLFTIIVVCVWFYYLLTDHLTNVIEWLLIIVILILTGSNIFIDVKYFIWAISTGSVTVSPYNIIAWVLFGLDVVCCGFYLWIIFTAGLVDTRLTLILFTIFLLVALAEAVCTAYFVIKVKDASNSSYRYMPVVQLIPQFTMNMPYF